MGEIRRKGKKWKYPKKGAKAKKNKPVEIAPAPAKPEPTPPAGEQSQPPQLPLETGPGELGTTPTTLPLHPVKPNKLKKPQ